jgi:cob(I)alamin adenosyltransferase
MGKWMNNKAEPSFALDERLPIEAIAKKLHDFSKSPCLQYFDEFPLALLVVNSHRQIVYSNSVFQQTFGASDPTGLIAMRPGEAMSCINAGKGPDGCGTSAHCRECGATRTLLKSITENTHSQQDCQLLIHDGTDVKAKDFRVFVSPWSLGDSIFFVATFMDIGDEKRRRVLERIFFHDILNSAGGASGLIEMLIDEVPEDVKETVRVVRMSLFAIVEEIQKQKQLLALERKEFKTSHITLHGLEVIKSIAAEYSGHPKAAKKNILVADDSVDLVVHTDFTLLRRAIVNMLVNALEATPAAGTVKLGLKQQGDKAVFWVWNSTVMPEPIKLQIFKRSFSTKGEDRGLGTYSIKILTENYLGGEAGFRSEVLEGTTFWIKLNLKPAPSI